MSIMIIKPGVLDTIQDLGRFGYGNLGINPGGVMDHFAAKVANIITGNVMSESILEFHFPGPQILFERDALISIAGADFGPRLNDEPLPAWQTIRIRKNTVLQFSGATEWARAYLAVHGGFAVDKWLSSYSTNMKAGAGGWQGRKLQKGDVLPFRQGWMRAEDLFTTEDNFQPLPWRPDIGSIYNDMHSIAFIRGNEWDELTAASKDAMAESDFMIDSSSDRMGYHLKGNPLYRADMKEMVSGAVRFGTMQLLPNGQMVVLMADHQTTGGYPRIGSVISAHLPRLAQLKAGRLIRFIPVAIEAAEESYFQQQQELQILRRACEDRLNKMYAAPRPKL